MVRVPGLRARGSATAHASALPRRPISRRRMTGVVLLLAGVALIQLG
jgi:hypothetical protein